MIKSFQFLLPSLATFPLESSESMWSFGERNKLKCTSLNIFMTSIGIFGAISTGISTQKGN